jgi:uncharacterized protein (DUF1499 family)
MKIFSVIVFVIIISIVISFVVLGKISKSGKAPGLFKGVLLKCPDKPNCVCSEQNDDNGHFIDPVLILKNKQINTQQVLKEIILELGGEIHADSEKYLWATFSSSFFGFVDDLEIRIDSNQSVIHIRSASRVGYSDFGANKKRADLIKKLFYKKTDKE